MSFQESLVKQMARISISNNSNTGETLFTHGKKNPKFEKKDFKRYDNDGPGESCSHYKNKFECHRCDRPSHIKTFYNVKLNSENYARKNGGSHDSNNSEDVDN